VRESATSGVQAAIALNQHDGAMLLPYERERGFRLRLAIRPPGGWAGPPPGHIAKPVTRCLLAHRTVAVRLPLGIVRRRRCRT
jgi:hypothetical protein